LSHLTETPADTIWRVVGPILKILFVLGVLGAIFAAWAVWQIAQSFPEIHPVPAPVAWVSRDVMLSPEAPVVRGRLVLTASSAPSQSLRVGLNAGAPAAPAIASPGALLAGPTVRMATDGGLGQDGCFAPCELQVSPAWDCTTSGCQLVADFSLEFPADAGAMVGVVSIEIAGGATGTLEDELPPNLEATLELGGDAAPGAS
jgi:hypothetical protein